MQGSSVRLPEDENTAEKRVDKIFSLMDKVCLDLTSFSHSYTIHTRRYLCVLLQNHDDQLTIDEFKEGAKKDPFILQALCINDEQKQRQRPH